MPYSPTSLQRNDGYQFAASLHLSTKMTKHNQNATQQNSQKADNFFLPDFCSVRMVFAVVIISELLAILLTLAPLKSSGDRWNDPKDFTKCLTIAEVLQESGYRTTMVGKWQGRDSALDRGFGRFFGPLCQAKISYFHEVQGNPYYVDRDRIELPDDFYLTDALNDYALRFLNESLKADDPFFLYVAHIAPHWPLHAREADVAPYRDDVKRELERRGHEVVPQRPLPLTAQELAEGVNDDLARSELDGQVSWSMDSCMKEVAKRGLGVIVLLAGNEGADQILASIDMALGEQPTGGDIPPDTYTKVGLGSQILRDIGVGKIHLMGAPIKYNAISGFDLEVLEFLTPGQ